MKILLTLLASLSLTGCIFPDKPLIHNHTEND